MTLQQLRDSWPEILEVVQKAKRSAWMAVYPSQARALKDDVLTLTFPNESDVADFKRPQGAGEGVSEYLRTAILEVLGLRVKFIAKVEPTLAAANGAEPIVPEPTPEPTAPEPTEPEFEPTEPDGGGWAVVEIPVSAPEPSEPARPAVSRVSAATPAAKAPAAKTPPVRIPATKTADAEPPASAAPSAPAPQRYGESVVREILGASFIEEQTVAPRVVPRES